MHILPNIRAYYSHASSLFRLFGNVFTVGSMIGGFTSGLIADCIGRKWAMGIASAFSVIGWITIFFSQGASQLDIKIFFCGFGIGIFAYVLMIVIGGSVAFLAGTVLTWRLLALTGIIPCSIQLGGLFFILESPRWLAKVGYKNESYDALKRFYGDDADISLEADEIQVYQQTQGRQPKAMFQRKYMHSVIIGAGLMMFQQFGRATGVGFYASETFTSAGFSSGKIGMIVCACIQIPITAVGALLVDKCGRKPLLLGSSIGTFLGCFLVAMSFVMKEHNMLQNWIPLSVLRGMLIFLGSFATGMASVPWILMSEIFPINVQGAAGSLVNLVHWFGAWAVSYAFNFLMNWSPPGTFFPIQEFVQLLSFL